MYSIILGTYQCYEEKLGERAAVLGRRVRKELSEEITF